MINITIISKNVNDQVSFKFYIGMNVKQRVTQTFMLVYEDEAGGGHALNILIVIAVFLTVKVCNVYNFPAYYLGQIVQEWTK